MQIASANSAASRAAATSNSEDTRASNAAAGDAAIDKAGSATSTAAGHSSSSTPSTKLTLSASAKEAHAAEKGQHAASSPKTEGAKDSKHADAGTPTGTPASAASKDDAKDVDGAKKEGEADEGKASTLKSFAYGSLGLQSPDEAAKNTDSAYSAGKWLAAAITVGGIISLLI